MDTSTQALTPPGAVSVHQTVRMLDYPIIKNLIEQTMPSLLDGSDRSQALLDQIETYLFRQTGLKAPELEESLTEELFLGLYGLKTLMQKQNLNVISWSLEEHQNRFREWLQQQDPSYSEEEDNED